MSVLFARRALREINRISWRRGATGVPLLPGAVSTLECTLRSLTPAGDHMILLAAVERLGYSDGPALVHFRSGYTRLAEAHWPARLWTSIQRLWARRHDLEPARFLDC